MKDLYPGAEFSGLVVSLMEVKLLHAKHISLTDESVRFTLHFISRGPHVLFKN